MKILIELPTWLGDTAMVTPAIENILKHFNGAEISLIGSFASTELLKNHPKLNIGKVKELHYFDNTDSPSIEEYEQLFPGSKGIKFEITPIYIYFKDVLKKIAFILKNKKKKILIVLRNPVVNIL